MQIVCISYTQWERSERFQRLIAALPEVQVLFFEPEQPLLSKLRRPREGLRLTDQVYAYTLPANVPTGEDSGVQITQRSRKNVSYVRRCMTDQGVQQPLLWLTCPDQAGFLYEFTGARGVVYDCDQDWRGYPYDWEAAVTEEADVVLAASRALAKRLSPLNDNVALLPNGVDYQAYAPAAEGFDALPADLERISSPVIGYLGEVTGFTLLSPVLEASQNHPEWSFVFVGPYSKRNPLYFKLSKLDNVHFLGEKSPSTLPRYLSGFDVCFSLLNEHAKDPSVVSEQIYRYLAACKPVAMLSGGQLDGLDKNQRLVNACHFDYEFSVTLGSLLDLELDPERRVRQREFARQADWSLCSQRLSELLSAAGLS